MANSTTLKSRIVHCTKTSTQWASTSTIALKGELLFEVFADGSMPKMKLGDGTNSWADLPYLNYTETEIRSWISQGAYNLNPATTAILGGVIIGSNISVTSDGTISIADATTGVKGVVQLSDSTSSTSSATAATSKAVQLTMQKAQQGVDDAATATGLANTAQTTADQAVEAAATAQTTANNAMPKSGGTFTGDVFVSENPTADNQISNKAYVDSQIATRIAANDSMKFMGTLGSGGTVTTLPTSNVERGHTYKVIVAGTYAGQSAKIGDMFIAIQEPNPVASSAGWAYIPSGDEIVTTVKYSTTTQNLTTSAQSGAITVGEAATKQVDTSITSGSTSTKLPTSAAVASFVEGKGYSTTDEKVKNELKATTKAYITGTTSATTNTGTQVFDTGVYLDTTAGTLHATKMTASGFEGPLTGNVTGTVSGNAGTATKLASAVNVSVTGLASGDTTTFDGSAALEVNIKSFDVAGLTQQTTHYLILDGNFS